MKQIIIGDIHGRTIWKDIVEAHLDADRFTFIGDYVDSFDVSSQDQLNNLAEIIQFKRESKKQIVLLVGNHDFQYIDNNCFEEIYSGYQSEMHKAFNFLFTVNKDLFQMCFEDEYQNVYSHAGLTKTFIKNHIGTYSEDQINKIFKYKPQTFKFSQFDRSGCGDSVEQSCIWVRPSSLSKDQIDKFQVVGHTTVNKIDHYPKSKRKGFFLIDCLQNRQYLSCTDGEFNIETFE